MRQPLFILLCLNNSLQMPVYNIIVHCFVTWSVTFAILEYVVPSLT